jgi:hypothetical protein
MGDAAAVHAHREFGAARLVADLSEVYEAVSP